MTDAKRAGDILVERGVIDGATAELIEAERLLSRSRFLSAAVAHGRVSEADALAALATREGVPAVDLAQAVIPTAVLKRVPLQVARTNLILPLREEGSHLLVAMANPNDRELVDELGFATGAEVLPHAALYSRLVELIPRAYAESGALARGPRAEARDVHIPVVADRVPQPEALDVELVFDSDLEPLEPEDPAAADAGGRKMVLVVDDEPDIAELVATTVGQLGHDIVTASRGLEALALIKRHRPALIVLDAMLPEVHGFEICRKVKESRRFGRTPVLMLSAIYRGWGVAEDIKATYKADAFLEKPFRIGDLRRLVQQLLAGRGGPVVEALGEEARVLMQEAQRALALRDPASAVDKLRRAESLAPFSAAVQLLLGQALEQRERPLQAIFHYERASELDPLLFAAARNAAVLYQARGFARKAIELWERALRSAPAEQREQIKQHLVSLL